MKAKISVNFKEILGMKVDEALLKKTPQLRETTEKTCKLLCENIEKYFNDHKIKTKASFILEG
jgi:hypothetical protein